MTWKNNFWHTRVISNCGPYSDEDFDSECDDELDSDDMST
jgi:hypothetical protein